MRGRRLTEADRAAWAGYARRITPLPGVSPPSPPTAPEPAPPEPTAAAPPPVARPVPNRGPAAPLVVGDSPGGIDRASWTRFRGGKLPPARTLDLHGRTVRHAHAALEQFLHQASLEGLRCVEVITGRGSGETGGVIRREFPFWLNQPHLRPLILAAAHPHPANPGSVRILLRRARG